MSNNEEKPKNKGGRPPSTEKLLAKIEKLEKELIEAKSGKLEDVLATSDLTKKGYSVILDREKKQYFLVKIGFNLESKLAHVEEVKFIADSYSKMIFELKKLVANNVLLQEK